AAAAAQGYGAFLPYAAELPIFPQLIAVVPWKWRKSYSRQLSSPCPGGPRTIWTPPWSYRLSPHPSSLKKTKKQKKLFLIVVIIV
ncbi:iroquois homeobox 3, partial [Homo sapiens]